MSFKTLLQHITWRKTVFCLFVLSVSHIALAQQPADSVAGEKTKFIGKIGHWLAAYGISGEEFLQQRRDTFKSVAFAEVYFEGIIDHPAWMFTMLNRVTKAKYAAKQTPYILFEIRFKPKDDNLNSYDVTLMLQEGGAIGPTQDEGIVAAASQKYLGGKVYSEPARAGEDIEKAIREALDGLQAKLGSSLAPDLMVRYENEVFWNGHQITVLEAEGNYVELEAVDKNLQPVPSGELTWTNADPFQSKGVVDMTGTASKTVTLRRGDDDPLTVTVSRVNASQDIRELLKQLIVQSLTTKKQEAADSAALLKQDSIANAQDIARVIRQLEAQNFPLEGGNAPVALFTDGPRTMSPQDEGVFDDAPVRNDGFRLLRKRRELRMRIRKKVNVVAFANLIVGHPERVEDLLEGLLASSGRLVAQLILNRNQQGVQDAARNIVVDYLNKNIEQVAGGTFGFAQETEPPLSLPVAASPASGAQTFSATKYLYINNQVAFDGKETFITEMEAYLRGLPEPLYVFINYSQDVSTASYLQRATSTRPKGLPEGAKFVTLTLVNIPGSVKYQVVCASPIVLPETNSLKLMLRDYVKLFESVSGIFHTYCTPDPNLSLTWTTPKDALKTYLTPSGHPIRFSVSDALTNLSFGGFTCEGETSTEVPASSQQVLSAFRLNGIKYIAVIDIPRFGTNSFLGYALIPENSQFDDDKVDDYTYYNPGTTNWAASVNVSIPINAVTFEECAVVMNGVDLTSKTLMSELPCPNLSMALSISKLKRDNLAVLNQNLHIKVLKPIEYPWQSGRRYYLNEESQTGNDYWITQLWNEVHGPYFPVTDQTGYISMNSYVLDNLQKAYVGIPTAVKAIKDFSKVTRTVTNAEKLIGSLALLAGLVNADITFQSPEILSHISFTGETRELQIVATVIQLREDLIHTLKNATVTPEGLRELINLLFQAEFALRKAFAPESNFPFHLVDIETLKIRELDIRTIVTTINEEAEPVIILPDIRLEELTRIVTHPEFDRRKYPIDETDDSYSVYASIRDHKVTLKIAAVTQPLFYAGITTQGTGRYSAGDGLVQSPFNFEWVAQDIDKSTARGIEQILIMLNNNGQNNPSNSKTLDNRINSTDATRDVYIYRLIRGYLYLLTTRPDWLTYYHRPPRWVETKLRAQDQWSDLLYSPQQY